MINDIQNKIKGVLLGTIIGDAVGTPLDGLSKAHIFSIFKNIDKYTDPGPALKGKLQNWKKPGSYTSISQLMILLSLYISSKRQVDKEFVRFISNLPESGANESGIFRHPDAMIRHLIIAKPSKNNKNDTYSAPCSRTAVILIPLIFQNVKSYEALIIKILTSALIFNKDINSLAGSLIFNTILVRIINENSTSLQSSILPHAVDELHSLTKIVEILARKIFELGINPDHLLSSIRDYLNILSKIEPVKDIEYAEKQIYNYLNTKIKTPVTRATINHPMTIIPYSIYFADFFSNNPSDVLFHAAESGGSTSILCTLTGALTGAMHGYEWIPDNLMNELINKKRIFNIIDTIIREKVSGRLIQEFVQSEASITMKEIQEKNAKLKHIKVKIKKKKSHKEQERKLSAHVVESWTKIDKAKWRKKLDKKGYD